MSTKNTDNTWRGRSGGLISRVTAWLGLRPLQRERGEKGYPDYLVCPHCGEPEVEVWDHEQSAHCHNCGRDFEPADGGSALA